MVVGNRHGYSTWIQVSTIRPRRGRGGFRRLSNTVWGSLLAAGKYFVDFLSFFSFFSCILLEASLHLLPSITFDEKLIISSDFHILRDCLHCGHKNLFSGFSSLQKQPTSPSRCLPEDMKQPPCLHGAARSDPASFGRSFM